MVFSKIAEIVKNEKLKPSDAKYHVLRDLLNDQEEKIGKIRILVTKDNPDEAHVEILCPECKKETYQVTEWNDFKSESGRKTAFRPVCPECGNKLTIRRMQDEQKRREKKRKKQGR